jgi:hypothetical protein
MHSTAELIGAAAGLVGLGILTLVSVRSIGRRRPPESAAERAVVHRGAVRRPRVYSLGDGLRPCCRRFD